MFKESCLSLEEKDTTQTQSDGSLVSTMTSSTVMTRTFKKLAIVGNGITKMDAPFDNKEWDIWTTGSVSKELPRVTMIWDIHKTAIQDNDILNAHDCAVIMQQCNDGVVYSANWEPSHLVDMWGQHFNGSMNYMLGEAVRLNYDIIVLYGVDMLEDEYKNMREHFVYLIGLFRGMGKIIEISQGSSLLLNQKCYEYEKSDPKIDYLKSCKNNIAITQQNKIESARRAELECEYVRGFNEALGLVLNIMGA